MKIIRATQLSFFPVKNMFTEYDVELHGDFGDSKADFTAFVPTAESVRSLPVGDIGLQHYDFPDGRDDGRQVPIGRKRGVDIAELSEEILVQQGSISEQWKEYKANEKLDQIAKNANTDVGSQGSQPSE